MSAVAYLGLIKRGSPEWGGRQGGSEKGTLTALCHGEDNCYSKCDPQTGASLPADYHQYIARP